jgi:Xaa-Pro aminopeptidase
VVKQTVEDLGIRTGKIGAELGGEQRLGISYRDFCRISQALPGIEFVDASEIFWGLRMIKSPAEVDCMRKACQITGQALETCFGTVRPGMKESEAVKILLEATVDGGGAAAWAVSNSGPYNYESGFLTSPSHEKLEPGCLLWLDTGCKFNGYACDFSRMAAVGEPSEDQQRMYDIVDGITRTVAAAVKPGVSAASLSRLCNAAFEKAGLADLWGAGDCSTKHTNRAQRIGHGIGMATTEPPHIAVLDETVLAPGMTVTIEPTIAMDCGHFNIEANVLVTDGGCEVLSTASRELFRIR